MPANTRILRRRIKSIGNTRKITKAMELVAASKMRKAVDAALNTRPFAQESWEVLRRIIGRGDAQNAHPLLAVRGVQKILVLLLTSNRGLVGGLNSNIIRDTLRHMKDSKQLARNRVGDKWIEPTSTNIIIEAITVGKKGEGALSRAGFSVLASFGSVSDTPQYEEARPIAKLLMEKFEKGGYDKVVIAYNDFVSAVQQKTRLRQLLPVSSVDIEKMIAQAGRENTALLEERESKTLAYQDQSDYTFEPSQNALLDYLVPKLVVMQVYQALLESSASEHSARMVAMKNASDAAKDLITDLQLTSNQMRQAGITAEIAEISAGKAALE